MMEISLEDIITELVVNGGSAKSKAMQAMKAARMGDFDTAEIRISEANESLQQAHFFQTELIQAEARGEKKSLCFTYHGSWTGSFNECDDNQRYRS
ncbi:hypothetical protein DZS_07130 [Dickeya ananatis]